MTSTLVVPGEEVGTGTPGDNVYEENGTLYSEVYGFRMDGRKVSVIPVKGTYVPKEGDQIVGIVTDVSHSTWTVDINSPYTPVLHISRVEKNLDQGQLKKYMDIGDAMRTVIDEVDREKSAELSLKCHRCGPLEEGRIVTIEPTRVSRVIGRDGNMVGMIRSEADVDVFVGNNGRIWIHGDEEDEDLAAATVEFIAEHAHEKNLTDRVKQFMEDW